MLNGLLEEDASRDVEGVGRDRGELLLLLPTLPLLVLIELLELGCVCLGDEERVARVGEDERTGEDERPLFDDGGDRLPFSLVGSLESAMVWKRKKSPKEKGIV